MHQIRSHIAMMSETFPCEKPRKQAADEAQRSDSDIYLLRAVALRGANTDSLAEIGFFNSFLS